MSICRAAAIEAAHSSDIVASSRNVWSALRLARRGKDSEEVREMRRQMELRWGEIAEHLGAVAAWYNEEYVRLRSDDAEG